MIAMYRFIRTTEQHVSAAVRRTDRFLCRVRICVMNNKHSFRPFIFSSKHGFRLICFCYAGFWAPNFEVLISVPDTTLMNMCILKLVLKLFRRSVHFNDLHMDRDERHRRDHEGGEERREENESLVMCICFCSVCFLELIFVFYSSHFTQYNWTKQIQNVQICVCIFVSVCVCVLLNV